MELRQLLTFSTVAKTHSFTHAARILSYAQSTITAQIKTLEAELQVSLFDRRGGRVKLTSFGKRLLPYAERLVRLSEEARRTVLRGGFSERLTVGADEVITTYRLPVLIEAFYRRYPNTYVSLQKTTPDDLKLLRTADLDEPDVIVLHGTGRHRDDLAVQRLGREDMALVVAPDNPITRYETVDPRTLSGFRNIVTGPDCLYGKTYEDEFGQHGAQLPERLEFGTVEAVKRAVLSGLGVSLLPYISVQDLLDSGELVRLPWQPTTPVDIYAAWPESQNGSEAIQGFVSLVADVVGGMHGDGDPEPAPSVLV